MAVIYILHDPSPTDFDLDGTFSLTVTAPTRSPAIPISLTAFLISSFLPTRSDILIAF